MSQNTGVDLGSADTSDPGSDGADHVAARARHRAATAVQATERSLLEHGDRVLAEDRAAIERAIAELKAINDGDDFEAINARSEALIEASMKMGEAIFAAKRRDAEHGPRSAAGDAVNAELARP